MKLFDDINNAGVDRIVRLAADELISENHGLRTEVVDARANLFQIAIERDAFERVLTNAAARAYGENVQRGATEAAPMRG